MITDDDYLNLCLPLLDVSALKVSTCSLFSTVYLPWCVLLLMSYVLIFTIISIQFKERDFLEGIFKFWRNPDDEVFDISKHWCVILFPTHTVSIVHVHYVCILKTLNVE